MWQMRDMGSGWWLLMALMMVALVALAIWVVAKGFAPNVDARPEPPRETPTEILDRRFAAGEITIEDYEQRRSALGTGGRPTAA